MAKITEAQFKKAIQNQDFDHLFFLYGEESYLIDYYAKKLISSLIPEEMRDFSLHIYQETDDTIDDIASAVETLPMFSDKNCVVVKDLPLDKLGKVDLDKLNQLIEDIPETSYLIFYFSTTVIDNKKNAKWRNLIEKFTELGTVIEFSSMPIPELIKLLIHRAKRKEKILSQQNARFFVETVGNDIHTLLLELDKLIFYAKTEEITKNDIETIATKSLEASVFDLTRAISRHQNDKAFESLHYLITQKTEPVMILGTIIGDFVDMYRVKSAVSAQKPAIEVAKHFPYRGREFRLKNAGQTVKSITLSQLRECLSVLLDTDYKLKFTNINNNFALEECIVKLLSITDGKSYV